MVHERGVPGRHPATDPAWGGPLLVGRVGSIAVVTDELIAHRESLEQLHSGLLADAVLLDRVDALATLTKPGAPPAAVRSEAQLDDARGVLRSAAALTSATGSALAAAVDAYAAAELEANRRAQGAAAGLGALLGSVARLLWPTLLLAGVGVWAVLRDPDRQRELADWLIAHPEIITDPAFVDAVQWTAMSTDDAAGGIVGLPPGVMAALLAAAGFTGVQGGAAVVIGAARPFGMLRETAVGVTRVSSFPVSAAPQGVEGRLARVPEGDQVRIERYDAPGRPSRYVVYVGPTETFSPMVTTEPWDLSSNVGGVAGLDAGSLRATELAMRDAGIGSGDRVQFVGFSQGGLVATMLASSPEWNAAGLTTFGAPAGNITLPDGLAGMAVRNTDDFVPALAGPQFDHHLLQVERQAFAPGSPIRTDQAAPGHQRDAYVATASVIDTAQSAAVRDQIAATDAFTHDYTSADGGTVTAMTYHAERVDQKQLPPAMSGRKGVGPLATSSAS